MTDKQKMDKILQDLESDEHVQQMKNYTQHGKVSTYEHCERVAKLSYKLNKKLHLHAKVPTLIKGAMLHDFYLYDWHHEDNANTIFTDISTRRGRERTPRNILTRMRKCSTSSTATCGR